MKVAPGARRRHTLLALPLALGTAQDAAAIERGALSISRPHCPPPSHQANLR